MLNVYHFILDHRVGGPHVYVRGLALNLAPQITSVLVTTGRGTETDWALTNIRHRFKTLYLLELIVNTLRICWRFRSRNNRKRVIFDVHGAANLAPIIAARLLSMPLVWHFHETLPRLGALANMGKKIAAGINCRYVAVAETARDVFALQSAKLIPGGVDIEFWRPMKALDTGEEHLRLLAVGNLNPLKGFDILLKTLDGFKRPCKLVIAGCELETYRVYAESLYDHAERLRSLGHHAEFVGWQSPAAIRRLMANADVFVMPSRSEACPIALLEAMASSCACVATNVGDIPLILSSPECGLIAKNEDSEALMDALEKVATLGINGRLAMGRHARERIVADYSLRKMAESHLEIYNSLS